MANYYDKTQFKRYSEKEPWEKQMDNYDRTIRRREAAWRKRVVRIDPNLLAQVTDNAGNIALDRINDLEPVAGQER